MRSVLECSGPRKVVQRRLCEAVEHHRRECANRARAAYVDDVTAGLLKVWHSQLGKLDDAKEPDNFIAKCCTRITR